MQPRSKVSRASPPSLWNLLAGVVRDKNGCNVERRLALYFPRSTKGVPWGWREVPLADVAYDALGCPKPQRHRHLPNIRAPFGRTRGLECAADFPSSTPPLVAPPLTRLVSTMAKKKNKQVCAPTIQQSSLSNSV